MDEKCQIPNALEKVFAASHCSVAFLGGSITTAAGASNSAETSWRRLFVKYLYTEYHPKYQTQVSEVMGAMGASESYAAVFTLVRNVLPMNPDLAVVEYCVNDRGAPDKDLVIKGMEGIIRQLLMAKHHCDVIILGTGCRPGAESSTANGSIDHTLHRQVAEHYDIPFVDAQDYMYKALEARGQTWDDASIDFVEGDALHLNDYGNQLVFEALRDGFEQQVALFKQGKRKGRKEPVPPPMVSDELQFIELVDPAKGKHPGLTLEGSWAKKPDGLIPWYYDNLLMGQPGAKLRLEFKGTAVALFGLMYNNGLKVNAVLDGEPTPGPYLRHFIEFGKGFVIAHGLPNKEHVMELTVGEASKRHNKLGDPTAQIAYIGIACPPETEEPKPE